jgi:pilus assembly protein Flp/PilA
MKSILAFLKDEEGQTSTEYILLVAVVALIVFKFKDIALSRLTALTEGVFGKADDMVNSINGTN